MESPLVSAVLVMVVAFAAFRMLPRLLAGVPFVDPQTVNHRMEEDENAVMIDVRSPEEYKGEHVDGSLNVQPHELGENIEEKKAFLDTKIYVICLTSQRAAMAAKTLKGLGFTNVSVVKGGIKLWKKQGLPVI